MKRNIASALYDVNSHRYISERYIVRMDRISRLKLLINERFAGNQAEFARAIDRSPALIWQYLKGRRKLGEEMARHIEHKLRLDFGWIDGMEPRVHEEPAEYGIYAAAGPDISTRLPLISWTTAGHWGEVQDNYQPGDAEDWIATTASVGPHAYALRIRGDSMEPTIPDGAIVIVDPDTEAIHNKIVIVRQNGNTEATCKRLILDGGTAYLRPDNSRYPVLQMNQDAIVCGVVRQVVISMD
jgi:SOS-response transcriptional repressor LexA